MLNWTINNLDLSSKTLQDCAPCVSDSTENETKGEKSSWNGFLDALNEGKMRYEEVYLVQLFEETMFFS